MMRRITRARLHKCSHYEATEPLCTTTITGVLQGLPDFIVAVVHTWQEVPRLLAQRIEAAC